MVGNYNPDPFLNSIIYDVEFPDGTVKEYVAKIISQNILATVDKYGYSQLVLDTILYHSKNNASAEKEINIL